MRYPVVGVGIGAREKHQVARLQLVWSEASGRRVLLLRRTWQSQARLAIHKLDQPRAIQADGRVRAAEDVRHAQVAPRDGHNAGRNTTDRRHRGWLDSRRPGWQRGLRKMGWVRRLGQRG